MSEESTAQVETPEEPQVKPERKRKFNPYLGLALGLALVILVAFAMTIVRGNRKAEDRTVGGVAATAAALAPQLQPTMRPAGSTDDSAELQSLAERIAQSGGYDFVAILNRSGATLAATDSVRDSDEYELPDAISADNVDARRRYVAPIRSNAGGTFGGLVVEIDR